MHSPNQEEKGARRLMTRGEAADYCGGISAGLLVREFGSAKVRIGTKLVRWDRTVLDALLDAKRDSGSPSGALGKALGALYEDERARR